MAQAAAPVAPESQPTRSHGRGGAGNISSKPANPLDTSALQTPTIKSSTYTTGRGGQGNMAVNNPNDPAIARAAQDVEAPRAHDREPKGTYHWGRGGEGNMMTLGGAASSNTSAEKAEGGAASSRPAHPLRASSRVSIDASTGKRRTGSFQAALEKGREIFGLNAKKDAAAADENAIEG